MEHYGTKPNAVHGGGMRQKAFVSLVDQGKREVSDAA